MSDASRRILEDVEKQKLWQLKARSYLGVAAFILALLFVAIPGAVTLCHLETVWSEGLDVYEKLLSLDRAQFADELLEFMKWHTVARSIVTASLVGFGYLLMRASHVLTRQAKDGGEDEIPLPPKQFMELAERISKLVKGKETE